MRLNLYVHVQDLLNWGFVVRSASTSMRSRKRFNSRFSAVAVVVPPQDPKVQTSDACATSNHRSRLERMSTGFLTLASAVCRSSCYCSVRYLNRATCARRKMNRRSGTACS